MDYIKRKAVNKISKFKTYPKEFSFFEWDTSSLAILSAARCNFDNLVNVSLKFGVFSSCNSRREGGTDEDVCMRGRECLEG